MSSKRTDSGTMARAHLDLPEVEHFRTMAELSTDFIGMVTADGVTIYVNPAGRQMCGIEPADDLKTITLQDFHPKGEVAERLHQGIQVALSKGTWRGDTVLLAADGTEIPGHQLIIAHNSCVGDAPLLSTIIRDNRAILELESKLAHAQRLESIGRLAGGVAHDFNNLLTVIENYVELARDELDAEASARRDLDVALDATARAATLCRQLLSFARKEVIRPRVTDLNQFVEQFASLVERLVGEHIRLELDLEKDPCRVTVDPGQLDQVLANLVVNSRDAMPDGGLLTISTRLVSNGEGGQGPPGDYVELGVFDTGVGMSEEVRQRAFDPFFTTKGAGHGTGLGLSTVYGAVTQNSGHVFLESAPGEGTRLRILWPETALPKRESARPPARSTRGGSERILLVEDEEMVRVLAGRALRGVGYQVTEAATPAEALELVAQEGQEIDLLLSDVVMPGMNGKVLAERIRALLPEIPVLFMSGYTDSVLSEGGVISPDVALLAKPFNREQLLAKVRDVLQGGMRPLGKSSSG